MGSSPIRRIESRNVATCDSVAAGEQLHAGCCEFGAVGTPTTVFGTANTAKYNVLVTAINNVINSETKEEIEKNMETYRTAYSE